MRVSDPVGAAALERNIPAEYRGRGQGQHIVPKVECEAFTDFMLFRQALQNTVDNAIKFDPPAA